MIKKLVQSKTASLLIPLVLFSAYSLLILWLWRRGMHTTTWNYSVNLFDSIFYFLAASVAWYGYKQAEDSQSRKIYIAWAAGLSAWGIGLLVWSYYNLILKVAVPFPSLADIVFVSYYGFAGYGLLTMERLFNDKNRLPILSSIPIVIISSVMVFFIFNKPDLSGDLPFLQRFLNTGYSLGDSFLLSMTLVVLQNSTASKRRGPMYIIITAFLVMLIADFAYYYYIAKQTYYNGDICDLLYGLFALLLVWGMARSIQSGWLSRKKDITDTIV